MASFLIWIVLCLVVNSVVSLLVTTLGGNSYLATMVTSLVLSFLVAINNTRFDRKNIYRQRFFWVTFMATALIFLLLDLLMFLI